MGGNSLGDRGVLHLVSLLQDDQCPLQSIGLGGNDIQDEGAVHLAAALKSNTQLRSLGLGGNQISDDGGRAFGEMLKYNYTLRKLLLSSNILGDSGVVHIAEGLASNSTLEMLLLADNPFGDEGGMRLTEVLCSDNTTLKVLDLHGTHMSKGMERRVVEEIHQHGHLTKLGTAFGTKSPSPQHSLTEQNEIVKRQAREDQARWFQQQASAPAQGEYLL
jgi:hypothetical protein